MDEVAELWSTGDNDVSIALLKEAADQDQEERQEYYQLAADEGYVQ